ncbi:MAG TPA: hypothetical protein VIK52_14020, partial [Opitutaceae bacterium]
EQPLAAASSDQVGAEGEIYDPPFFRNPLKGAGGSSGFGPMASNDFGDLDIPTVIRNLSDGRKSINRSSGIELRSIRDHRVRRRLRRAAPQAIGLRRTVGHFAGMCSRRKVAGVMARIGERRKSRTLRVTIRSAPHASAAATCIAASSQPVTDFTMGQNCSLVILTAGEFAGIVSPRCRRQRNGISPSRWQKT